MARLRTLLVVALFALLGVYATGISADKNLFILIAVLVIETTWYINGTCINDIADEEIDKINLKNAPSRPLINNKATKKELYNIAIITGVVSLAVAAFLNHTAVVLTSFGLVLNYVYSMPPFKLSYRGAVAIIILPVGYVLLPFLLAATSVHGTFTATTFLLLAGSYIAFMGRILLKDFRDVKGDRKFGKRTFLVRYGTKATIIASSYLWVVGSICTAYACRTISQVMSLIIIVQCIYILWLLSKFYSHTISKDQQQIVIGAIAKTASVSIICMILALSESVQTKTGHTMLILIQISIVSYMFFVTFSQVKNYDLAKVSY